MPNYLKFPSSFKQHITAINFSGVHSYSGGHGEDSDYEPDGDNFGGPMRYAGFAARPSSMPKLLQGKYTNYISRSNKAGGIVKWR